MNYVLRKPSMKNNKKIFSRKKSERIEGYKKLFKAQIKNYDYSPSSKIAANIVEAMSALGYDIDVEHAMAYLKASYAVHERDFYERQRKV